MALPNDVYNQILATLKAVNNRRSELSKRLLEKGKQARRYKVGDKVLVDRRNLTIPEGTTRALSGRWIGPYKITKDKWDGHAYELDIPARTRIHKVIHVSLLKPGGNPQPLDRGTQ